MSKKTVSSKEALFMLDEDMEQEMQSYQEEVTKVAIKFINKTPELYSAVKGHHPAYIHGYCEGVAQNNNSEFGDLFITELEQVDWEKVARSI